MSAICDRRTPYDELSEVNQVTDRLVLEELEALLDHADRETQNKAMGIIRRKLEEISH
jgi:hypothetical protein